MFFTDHKQYKKSLENYNIDSITENVIMNKDDIIKDFDKFESGKSNVLLITGLTGSGKSTIASTLSSKYHAQYIELDLMDPHSSIVKQGMGVMKKAGNVFYEYLQTHKNIYDNIIDDKMTDDDIASMMDNFFEYCLSYAGSHKDKKFIIEGIQIYEYYSYHKKSINHPIIIKGTSVVSSFLRKIKREKWDFREVMKNAPDTLKLMVTNDKQLRSLINSL